MKEEPFSIKPIALLKYSTEEYLNQLLDGKLYFNTYRNLAGAEDNVNRGDRYELVHKQITSDKIIVPLTTYNATCIITKLTNGKYILNYRNDDFLANMFCLYSITAEKKFTELKHKLDKDMRGLGTRLVMIYNVTEFVRRVQIKLNELNLEHIASPIKYIEVTTPEWTKSYLEKPRKFAYQKELRIAFKSDIDEPRIIDIGDIRDIAQMMPSSIETIKIHSSQTALQKEIEDRKNYYLMDYCKKVIQHQILLDNNSSDAGLINRAKLDVEEAQATHKVYLEGIHYKD